MWVTLIFLVLLINKNCVLSSKPNPNFLDICGINNGKRLYVEFGISGTLSADYKNFLPNRDFDFKKCSVEFVTCPSCIIEIKFSYLNISRNCGKTSLFDTCGCQYVLLSEPSFKESSGEQFCGRFKENNVTYLDYVSKSRSVAIEFSFIGDFGNAFSLDFTAIRNRVQIDGYPKIGQMANTTASISSPFFPHIYPTDLSVEYVIACHSENFCRIKLMFTDFLLAESSIIEFFDWNGTRMYVTSGSVFRPPIIVSSGANLTVRFYANGASDFGFKATYSFVLGYPDDDVLKPNIDKYLNCGGHVSNLGGGITMMKMIKEGVRFFDCLWLIRPPLNYMQRKTHLYVKVINFSDFAGTTELIIRQGLTSNEPIVEALRYPLPQFNPSKEKEHVVPISEGFYISFKGPFKSDSQVSIVYAAFNYKDCFSGLDFLCHNLRCISMLLNCDGFNHCGDNSDETLECSEDPRDHRRFSKVPNFLFPKSTGSYSDLTTATFVFLMSTFGLIGIILAMALLLYRVNIKARHQRRIHDHLETIHAILEEGVGELEEEIISPDDPPDYEAPPEYADVLKYLRKVTSCGKSSLTKQSCEPTNSLKTNATKSGEPLNTISADIEKSNSNKNDKNHPLQTTSKGNIPESPPPAYSNVNLLQSTELPCSSRTKNEFNSVSTDHFKGSIENLSTCFSSKILDDLALSWKRIKRINNANLQTNNDRKIRINKRNSSEENLLVRHFSDSEIGLRRNLNMEYNTIDYDSKNFLRRCKNLKKSFSTADLFSL